jgi:hypothetical protein
MDILKLYLENKKDYSSIIENAIIDTFKNESGENKKVDVTIIIPIMERSNQINVLIRYFRKSLRFHSDKKYDVYFVEHDVEPKNRSLVKSTGCNYIFIKREDGKRFNKCLAMNVGALLNKTEYYLFHDVDLIVKKDFLKNIFINLERTKNKNILHCLTNKNLIIVNDEKSEMIRNGSVNIENIEYIQPYTDEIEKRGEFMYGKSGAPGGSMFIKSDLFFEIGGYDDSFFNGYSAEDDFFWKKVNLYYPIESCDNPENWVFHLSHEVLAHTLNENHNVLNNNFQKLDLKLKKEYIKLKSKNLKYEKFVKEI